MYAGPWGNHPDLCEDCALRNPLLFFVGPKVHEEGCDKGWECIAVLKNCVGIDHDPYRHPAWFNHVIARRGTTKQSHYWLFGDCFGLRPRNDKHPIFSPTQTDITFENPYGESRKSCPMSISETRTDRGNKLVGQGSETAS
jgi:hypothetical protein